MTSIDSDAFVNREMSWIDFNSRVLYQANRKDIPLIERFKFLGITFANLDEFIMVRYGSVINKLKEGVVECDISGLEPDEEQELLLKTIIKFKGIQYVMYNKLLKELNNTGVIITKSSDLEIAEINHIRKLFDNEIFPLITPIAYDSTKEFPNIISKQLNLIISVEDTITKLNALCIISIDKTVQRIYKISEKENKYMLLEELVYLCLDKIFINKKILFYGYMRLLREGDVALEYNPDIYLIDRMKNTIIQREFSDPLYMELSDNFPKHIEKLLRKVFELPKSHIYKTEFPLDLSFYISKPIQNSLYEYKPFASQYPEELIGEHDMFTAINNSDILLHHPFESFHCVVKFLEHASEDKDVLTIKQTLYRVSSEDSPIVDALCKAAKNGKHVVVLLEIKARFDEEQNIQLIDKLKLSGCKIIYGFEKLKTHCKFILIVKKVNGENKLYSHIGTGNYNEKTSNLYTDISYFTSSTKIGYDLLVIFNLLSGFSDPIKKLKKLIISPYSLRHSIYKLIDQEIYNVKKGGKGLIVFKLNSLSDEGIITKLYEASMEGVKVKIIVRGINSMTAINDNIEIRSVIGRYLEHSRIYMFHNNGDEEYFISSADMLTRNLDRRVEILLPILDEDAKLKLKNILSVYFKDTFNTFIFKKDRWFKLNNNKFNSHEYLIKDACEKFKLKTIPKISFKNKK